jgi:hypothetical protein
MMHRIEQDRRSPSLTRVLLGMLFLAGGCGEEEGTSEFATVYVAAAYGTVTAGGGPAAGVTIRAHVYGAACEPKLSSIMSQSLAQTDAAGHYTVPLYSNESRPGQCVVLQRSDTGDSVAVSLDTVPFSARSYEAPRDSIRIDLAAD